jgi:hypothetical protein
VSLLGERLSDLIRRDTFRVLDISAVERGSAKLVRISFDNAHPIDTQPASKVQGGTFECDPAQHWFVVSAEVQTVVEGAKSILENDVTTVDGSFPVPRRSVRTDKGTRPGDTQPINNILSFDFDVRTPANLPKEVEFTLSAFGFPEPVYGRRLIPTYLWIALAGIVCVGVGFLLRRLSKRPTVLAP